MVRVSVRIAALLTIAVVLGGCDLLGGSAGSDDGAGAGDARAITEFGFLSPPVVATIDEGAGTISATVPAGTDVTALVASFTATGESVTVGTTAQLSGTTANDFTTPVTYTVTAADGSTAEYTVTVTVAPDDAKTITAFGFLSPAVVATIDEGAGTISATVPAGTDVTALVASFTTSGESVTVGTTAQLSGTTANDFTTPVTYTVTAADGSTAEYTVTVTVAPDDAKTITAFGFLSPAVVATIDEGAGTISATVPAGTEVTALVASFTTSGESVTVGTTAQLSGTTANDFTNPVTYTVTAADGSTAEYTVTVTVAPDDAKTITAFGFLSPAVVATIDEGTGAISATVPAGTDVTALVATFTTSGESVAVGATAQVSGTTANDFTAPVTYTVTAADGSTAEYTVTVTVALSDAKAITSFGFVSPAVVGTIDEGAGTISVEVANGTNVSFLMATFATTGESVSVGATPQTSGVSANDFTTPVTYTVTAEDGTTRDYVVTVTIAASDDATLSALTLSTGTDIGFAPDDTAYQEFIETGPTITVTATPSDAGATLSYTLDNNPISDLVDIPLNSGSNFIRVTVLAADQLTTRTYVLEIFRLLGNNANLSALTVSPGSLSPAFSSGPNTYEVVVEDTELNMTVTPTAVGQFSTVTVNGAAVGSGETSDPIALGFGPNLIEVVVTAESGVTKTYTINVTRRIPSVVYVPGVSLSFFGQSVSIDSDGNTIAVGRVGGVEVITGSGSSWSLDGRLSASGIGGVVSIDAAGNRFATGNPSAGSSGQALVYQRPSGGGPGWLITPMVLSSTSAASGDGFGATGVAIAGGGGRVVVGAADTDSSDGTKTSVGRTYLYVNDSGTSWSEEIYDPGDPALSGGDSYGRALAMSGNGETFAVGAFADNPRIAVYRYNGSTFDESFITASDSIGVTNFGGSVAVSSDNSTIVVGADFDPSQGAASGSAYVFRYDGTNWVETKLLPAISTANDSFGRSVAVSGDGTRVLVGAPQDGNQAGSPSYIGYATLFVFDGTRWTQALLRPSDLSVGDEFGQSVAISADGETAVVGAPGQGGSTGKKVYIFDLSWLP